MAPENPIQTVPRVSVLERIRQLPCEEHGLFARAVRRITVPLFNRLSERMVRKLLGFSPDGALIMEHCGSTLALEVMYAWHERDPFAQGLFQGCANLFWYHCISQPKSMRNRLRVVQKILREEIAKRLCASADPISILSLGGGSSRAMIQALSELVSLAIHDSVKVVNIDMDEKAIALGRQFAAWNGVGSSFRWVRGNAKDLGAVVEDGSVDVVEIVGLFDYFSDKIGEMMLRRIHRKLKPGGVLVIANVHPHDEMPFVSKMGWPKMYYRRPEDLCRLIAGAGFRNPPELIVEPLHIHMIATVRK